MNDPYILMREVKIIFENPKYNYSTTCSGTRKSIKNYFNTFLEVGNYPEEISEKPVKIKFILENEENILENLES